VRLTKLCLATASQRPQIAEWLPSRGALLRSSNLRALQIVQFDFAARRAEAFYWLDRQVRGRGIAVEALNLVTEWAFRDYGIVRVQLVTHLDNERSQRVAERRGFSREGVLRAWEPVKDEQPDVVMWSRPIDDPAPDLGHL
jgi:RimJ/RimL family protein N-acetyltransferase